MGEVSKNVVVVLALAVIVVSGIGTWAVLNAATDAFSGLQAPARQPFMHETLRGSVSVFVNGEVPAAPAPVAGIPATQSTTGMISVYVNG